MITIGATIYSKPVVGSGGFTPASIASLAYWFRADLGINKTGSDVNSWADQSGNNRHISAITTARPSVATAAINGHDAIDFDGVAEGLKNAAGFTLNQPVHIFAVLNQRVFTLNDTIWDGNANLQCGLLQRGTDQIQQYATTAGPINADATIPGFHRIEALYSGGGSTIIVDSGTAATGDPGATAASGFTLGCRGSSSPNTGPVVNNSADVQVAEIFAYSVAISGANLTAIRAYLTARYGI